ncbi:hypothetical protein [Longimicrobium sp.]|uniref:hypothetical protein n=1 Tax=Longimicrobium sp. TaxID=2029185 RepID=UPI002B6BA029|nr:hypothetical protein [Longimicrobium sp.]HSU17952.1 hypothetical protein [Longimicrobium sp.]
MRRHRFTAPLLAAAIAAAACRPPAGPPFRDPRPARVTVAELQRLRWIVGDWRGTGTNQPAFYERYRFQDDSTLVVESFADSSFSAPTDPTFFVLRGGRLGPDARTAASRIDARSVTFAPQAAGRNWYRFRYRAPDEWEAVLWWPATPTRPERLVTYRMVRVR